MLLHVRSSTEKRAAEEVADRTACEDFERFRPLFERVEQDLKSGVRKALRFGRDTQALGSSVNTGPTTDLTTLSKFSRLLSQQTEVAQIVRLSVSTFRAAQKCR